MGVDFPQLLDYIVEVVSVVDNIHPEFRDQDHIYDTQKCGLCELYWQGRGLLRAAGYDFGEDVQEE